jgi:hypothetical protein
MVVEPAPRLSMRRPNALLLRDGKTEFFLAFESKEERTLWMDTINQVYTLLITLNKSTFPS